MINVEHVPLMKKKPLRKHYKEALRPSDAVARYCHKQQLVQAPDGDEERQLKQASPTKVCLDLPERVGLCFTMSLFVFFYHFLNCY